MRVTEQSSFRGPEAQRLADQAPAPGAPQGRRLPVSPRERRPALAALAVLLIIGGALITTVLFIQSGDRVSAIAVAARVGAGQRIPEQALKEVQVAVTDVQYVPWSARGEVARHYAAVDLVPGTLLNDDMVSLASSELRPGKAVVGLSLKAGQVPAGLRKGDRVQVIFVPGEDGTVNGGKVLAPRAMVNYVGGGGESGTGGTTTVSVIVDTGSAAGIVAYASAGKIGLAYLPGLSADGGAATPAPSGTPGPEDSATGEPSAEPTGRKSRQSSPPPSGTGDEQGTGRTGTRQSTRSTPDPGGQG
ncbi:hypothetical protein Sru01_04980 [Sphaerisporangium rufum]|uniref:SAF domain-containing protein n=1 Tax=Sphaerisporangium rufum TaxID=1381558 RepID=A0A919QWQ6_9ACTN|nr:hypothetical protein [Sphaerisporangium rufum]GII75516.1 hypothetical protein Sru01_04980 [Sphaerisporangium rufum]